MSFPRFWEDMACAVGFFFLISGFLTGYIYKEKVEKYSFGEYFWSRAKGFIVPTFWANTYALILWLIEWYVFKAYNFEGFYIKKIGIVKLFTSYLNVSSGWLIDFLPINGPLWQISVLLLCEMIYWLINKIIKNNKVKRGLYILFVILGIAIFTIKTRMPFLYGDTNGRGYMCFFLGVLIYEIYEANKLKAWQGIVLLIAGLGAMQLSAVRHLCIFLLVNTGIFFIVTENKVVASFFSNKLLGKIGSLSLPIYMVHEPFMNMVYATDLYFDLQIKYESLLTFVVFLLVILLLAILFEQLLKVIYKNSKVWKKISNEIIRYQQAKKV